MTEPRPLSAEESDWIAHQALGTCQGEEDIALKFHDEFGREIDADDLLEALAKENVERCPVCDWWFESGELVDADMNPCPCPDCRDLEEDE